MDRSLRFCLCHADDELKLRLWLALDCYQLSWLLVLGILFKGMFSSQNFANFFKITRHIESFGRMHEALNIDKK
jgi:hypothetical protein